MGQSGSSITQQNNQLRKHLNQMGLKNSQQFEVIVNEQSLSSSSEPNSPSKINNNIHNNNSSVSSFHIKNTHTDRQYFLRTITVTALQDLQIITKLLTKRSKITSLHLCPIITFHQHKQSLPCSQHYIIDILIQNTRKTLAQQLLIKQNHSKRLNIDIEPFCQEEIWSFAYSALKGLKCLYLYGMTHECLTLDGLCIDEKGLVRLADPVGFGLEKNYANAMREKQKCQRVLSPEILVFLEEFNFYFYDKEKSDVFILGVLLLQLATLERFIIYDYESKKAHLDNLDIHLNKLTQPHGHQQSTYQQQGTTCFSYSAKLKTLLSWMVAIDPKKRPNIDEVLEYINQRNTSVNEQSTLNSHTGFNSPTEVRTVPLQRNLLNRNNTVISEFSIESRHHDHLTQQRFDNKDNNRRAVGQQQSLSNRDAFSSGKSTLGIGPYQNSQYEAQYKSQFYHPLNSQGANTANLMTQTTNHQHHNPLPMSYGSNKNYHNEPVEHNQLNQTYQTQQQHRISQLQLQQNSISKQQTPSLSQQPITPPPQQSQNYVFPFQLIYNKVINNNENTNSFQVQKLYQEYKDEYMYGSSCRGSIPTSSYHQKSYTHANNPKQNGIQQPLSDQLSKHDKQSSQKSHHNTHSNNPNNRTKTYESINYSLKDDNSIEISLTKTKNNNNKSKLSSNQYDELVYSQQSSITNGGQLGNNNHLKMQQTVTANKNLKEEHRQSGFSGVNKNEKNSLSNIKLVESSHVKATQEFVVKNFKEEYKGVNPNEEQKKPPPQQEPLQSEQLLESIEENLSSCSPYRKLASLKSQQYENTSEPQRLTNNMDGENGAHGNEFISGQGQNAYTTDHDHAAESYQGSQTKIFQIEPIVFNNKVQGQNMNLQNQLSAVMNYQKQPTSGLKKYKSQDRTHITASDKKANKWRNKIEHSHNRNQGIDAQNHESSDKRIGHSENIYRSGFLEEAHSNTQNNSFNHRHETVHMNKTQHHQESGKSSSEEMSSKVSHATPHFEQIPAKIHTTTVSVTDYQNNHYGTPLQIGHSAVNPNLKAPSFSPHYERKSVELSSGGLNNHTDRIVVSREINSNNNISPPPSSSQQQRQQFSELIYVQNIKNKQNDIYCGYINPLTKKKQKHGRLDFHDGGYYQGQWFNDKMQGYGQMFYDAHTLAYEGMWEDGCFNGKGIIHNDTPQQFFYAFDFCNFTHIGNKWITYEGEFTKDSKNGQGIIRLTNGEYFEGCFDFDMIEGEGRFYSGVKALNKKGVTRIIRGQWRDNQLVKIHEQRGLTEEEVESANRYNRERN